MSRQRGSFLVRSCLGINHLYTVISDCDRCSEVNMVSVVIPVVFKVMASGSQQNSNDINFHQR
jgi:hypothetical protein